MKTFTCAFSISNWQAITRNGGEVIEAGSLFLTYKSPEKIV